MKKLTCIIFLLLAYHLTFAQETINTERELKHGLQFQIVRLLELSNFKGYALAYRHNINKNSGLRVGILTNIEQSDNNVTEQIDTIKRSGPMSENIYQYKLSVQYLQNLTTYKSFSMFLGGGPFVSYFKSDENSEYNELDFFRKISGNTESVGYGLDLILGVEFKVIDNVWLSGEYGLTASKENAEYDNNEEYIYPDASQNRIIARSGDYDSFMIRSLGASLGISVFF